MKKLDDILKVAKPAVPDLAMDFSRRVMSEVEKLDFVKSPVLFPDRSVKWNQLAAGVVLLVLSLVIVNNIVFEVQMNGSIEMLYFGTQFLKDVLTYLPFDLIIPAVLATALSSWLMWHSKALKKGIATIIIGSYVTTTFGGAALAATSMNEKIQAAVVKEKREWPLVSWFFKERARFFVDHPNFRMGRVSRSDGRFVWIIDPHGQKSKIELPDDMRVQKGQIISMAGVKSGDLFRVSAGRHCNPGRAGKYFHDMPMMHKGMDHNMGGHRRMMHNGGMMKNRMLRN